MTILKDDLERLEVVMEDRDLEEAERWVWEECRKGIDHFNFCQNRDLKQKSRVRWAIDGDDNSAFFHRVVNGRKATNSIPGLLIEGDWIQKPALVKYHVMKHFHEHFKENNKYRPVIRCNNMKGLEASKGEELIKRFTKDEIKDAVFDCGSDRAPGPDGFNFRFVKHFFGIC